MGEETVTDGRRIVAEGAHGNWIWVILQGRVVLTRETRYGPLPVAQLGDGAFIGTFAALPFGGHVRAATGTAVGDVHLALLDTHRLSAEFRSLSPAFRDLLLNMSRRLKGVTDDLVALWTGIDFSGSSLGKHSFPHLLHLETGHQSAPSSMLIPEDLKEGLDLKAIQEEYDRLPKTQKNLVHYIGSSIYLTARMAWDSRKQEHGCPPPCPHSSLGKVQERR
jgi:CRP-like cAMP-binding protein